MEGIKYRSVKTSDNSENWIAVPCNDSATLNERTTDDNNLVDSTHSNGVIPAANKDNNTDDDPLTNENSANVSLVAGDGEKRKEGDKDAETAEEETIGKLDRAEKTGKWIKTILLYLAFAGVGMVSTLIGPTFLDLKDNLGVSTAQMSLAFTFHSGGYTLGGLVAVFLASRLNQTLLLALFLIIGAGFTIVIPWFNHLWLVLMFFSFNGITCGVIDTVASALLIITWGVDSGAYLQFLYFSYGVGSFITPLVAGPFISVQNTDFNGDTNASDKFGNESYGIKFVSEQIKDINYPYEQEASIVNMSYKKYDVPEIGESGIVLSKMTESQIEFVFLVVGLFSVVVGVLFTILYIFSKRTSESHLDSNDSDDIDDDIKDYKSKGNEQGNGKTCDATEDGIYAPSTKCFKLQLLITLFIMFFSYAAFQMTGGGLVMTFAVEGLKWPKSHGAAITSAYWGAFTLSRLLCVGIFASKILSANQIIVIDLTILTCSYAVMVIFVKYHPVVLWVTLLMAGLSMGTLYASVLLWYQKYVMPVTGLVTGVTVMGASLSATIVPLFTGFLIDKVHSMCFTYVLLTSQILLLLFAFLTYFLVRRNIRNVKQENDVDIQA